MRHEIDLLLLELWQDERCRACIKQQAAAAAAATAGAEAGVFQDFVSAVLNDLMYLFKDSLERLVDIKGIEDSKKNAKVGFCAALKPLHTPTRPCVRNGGVMAILQTADAAIFDGGKVARQWGEQHVVGAAAAEDGAHACDCAAVWGWGTVNSLVAGSCF